MLTTVIVPIRKCWVTRRHTTKKKKLTIPRFNEHFGCFSANSLNRGFRYNKPYPAFSRNPPNKTKQNKTKQKRSEKEVREPSHQASCFRREIGTGEDFLVTLLETTVQPTAVFATAAKVYIAILDRLHFYSMT